MRYQIEGGSLPVAVIQHFLTFYVTIVQLARRIGERDGQKISSTPEIKTRTAAR